MGLEPSLVEAVLEDWRTAPVDDRLRAALALLEVITLEPASLDHTHIEAARAAPRSEA